MKKKYCGLLRRFKQRFFVFFIHFLFVCLVGWVYFFFFFLFFFVVFSFNYYESKKSKNWRTIPNNVVN